MAQSWLIMCSKVASRFRREGPHAAVRHYFGRAKHLAHQIMYDRWLDRFKHRPSGSAYAISEDEIVGAVPPLDERLYRAFPRLAFLWSIEALGIDPTAYTFVDYGSGRGRLILTAAGLPFRHVIGVEFARRLHQDACENIAHYPRERLACLDVASRNLNAIDFDLPDGNVVAFFFNPFTYDVLDRVAQRIEDACRASARSVYIIFANGNRMPLFVDHPAFRPFRPSMIHRGRLAAVTPVPIEFFSVRIEAMDAAKTMRKAET